MKALIILQGESTLNVADSKASAKGRSSSAALTRGTSEQGQSDKAAREKAAREKAEKETRRAEAVAAEKAIENEKLLLKLKEEKTKSKELQKKIDNADAGKSGSATITRKDLKEIVVAGLAAAHSNNGKTSQPIHPPTTAANSVRFAFSFFLFLPIYSLDHPLLLTLSLYLMLLVEGFCLKHFARSN